MVIRMKFVAQKIGNRVQIKSYKDGECTKVTFLKYQKAFNALKRLEKQGHEVYVVTANLESFKYE